MARPQRFAIEPEESDADPAQFPPVKPRAVVEDMSESEAAAVGDWEPREGWSMAYVYRLWPRPQHVPTAKPFFLGTLYPPFGPDRLQELYGGGIYSVLFIDAQGKRRGSKRVSIVGEPKTLGVLTTPGNPDAPGVPAERAAQFSSSYTDPQMQMLAQSMQQILALLTAQQRQPSLVDKLQELRALREVFGAATPQADPQEFVKWMRTGVEAGKELATGGSQESGGMVEGIIAALPRVLDYLDTRRAAAVVQRQPSSTRVRRAAAPPQLPATTGNPAPPVQDARRRPTDNATPVWVQQACREFIRAQKTQDDPAFTAAWIERNVPRALVERWRTMLPSAVKGEIMQIAPLVARSGHTLAEDFVTAVAQELLLATEDETAVAAPAIAAVAPLSALPSQPIGDAPQALAGDDEDEDDEDFDDDDSFDDDEDDDDYGADDDDDDDADEDDDEDEGIDDVGAVGETPQG